MTRLKNGQYSEAITVLSQARQHDPDNINVLTALGQALACRQDTYRARQCFEQVLAVDPTVVPVHQELARLDLTGPHYLEALAAIQVTLQPKTYVEIGIRRGDSFLMTGPDTRAVGIDPNPLIEETDLTDRHLVIRQTSDDYFSTDRIRDDLNGRPVDLAFIDGMHLFEYALRDFIALERYAHPGTTILLHDCYPLNQLTAGRTMETGFWSGDVWKTILCLKERRPDLIIETLPCPPTGLAVIRGLNPASTVLADSLEELYRKYLSMEYSVLEKDKKHSLNLITMNEGAAKQLLGEP